MPSQTIIFRIVINAELVPLADIPALLAKLADFEPFLETAGQYMSAYQKQSFADQGQTFGNDWPPLAPSTLKEKKRLGYPATPLVRTGKLRDAIGQTIELGVDGVSVVTGINTDDVKYADYHDKGGGKLPQRVLVAVTDEEVDELLQLLREYLADGTGQAIGAIEIRSEVQA